MTVHRIGLTVQIGHLTTEVFKIPRFLYVSADGKHQPGRRIGIDIRFQIRVPGKHRMSVRIFMRETLVYCLFCQRKIKIKHCHGKLCVVSNGLFPQCAIADLMFRPIIQDAVKLRFGTFRMQTTKPCFARFCSPNNFFAFLKIRAVHGNQLLF